MLMRPLDLPLKPSKTRISHYVRSPNELLKFSISSKIRVMFHALARLCIAWPRLVLSKLTPRLLLRACCQWLV